MMDDEMMTRLGKIEIGMIGMIRKERLEDNILSLIGMIRKRKRIAG